MEAISTRELKERLEELTGQEVLLRGWIRNHRKQKNMGFIDFFDGTCFKNPQVVYDSTLADYAAVQAYHVGSAIEVRGKVVPAYKDPTTPEVQAISARRIILFSPSVTAWNICGRLPICVPVLDCSRRCSACVRWLPWPFTPIFRIGAMCMYTRL